MRRKKKRKKRLGERKKKEKERVSEKERGTSNLAAQVLGVLLRIVDPVRPIKKPRQI